MRTFRLLLTVAAVGAATPAAELMAQAAKFDPQTIIALERAALDRWGKGDPEGYLSNYSTDVTYFDPFQDKRIDGQATMRTLYGPIAGKVNVPRYEMINPKVQRDGNIAVLTFNLVSHSPRPNGDTVLVRWNSTSVYQLKSGKWKEIHSHWSFTKPDLPQPPSEMDTTAAPKRKPPA